MHALCNHLEDKLPSAKFSHSYDIDTCGRMLIRIEAWDESRSRYYNQLLRDTQEPEEVAERFYNRLKPRHPEPAIKLSDKFWLPR